MLILKRAQKAERIYQDPTDARPSAPVHTPVHAPKQAHNSFIHDIPKLATTKAHRRSNGRTAACANNA